MSGHRFWSLLRQLCECVSKPCGGAKGSSCQSNRMGSLQVMHAQLSPNFKSKWMMQIMSYGRWTKNTILPLHCLSRGVGWTDSPTTVLPVIKQLVERGIRVWMYRWVLVFTNFVSCISSASGFSLYGPCKIWITLTCILMDLQWRQWWKSTGDFH